MADINIAALPAAGAYADADIFHISQTGADYKTTLSAMDARFSKVDIYGLTETLTPTTAMFVAVGVDGTIANNKKVSLEKLGQLVQAESLFTNDEDIDADDEVPFRKDNAATLKQCTVGGLAKRVMTFPDLANALTAASVVDTDYGVMYDTSATEAKKINIAEYRQAMLNATSLTALTSPDNADFLYLYDSSTSDAKKITYSNLFAAVTAGLPFDDRISSTVADSAAGLIDFQAGIKSNTIVPSSGTDITVSAKLIVNSEIASALGTFTNVKGKVLGTNGNSGSLYLESVSSGSKWNIKGNELTPVDDNTTDLGTASLKYKALYANTVSTGVLSATTSAALPNNVTIRNAANSANLTVMDVDTVNRNILPVATSALNGVLELALLPELQENTPAALTQAITAGLLAQCVKQGTGFITVDGVSEACYGGSLKIAGLLIQWLKVEPTVNKGENPIPLLFSNYSWMHNFGDTHYLIMGGAITGWGGGYPTSIFPVKATIATTGFTYYTASAINPDVQIRDHFVFMIGKV